MNTVKIECNPYTKQIKYYWMDNEEGEWRQLTSPESPFSKPKFTGTTLQNVAYEIVTELNKTYNPGNIGMEIYFDGTKEDMEDLKSIVERYFNECGIQVKMGETYLLSAVDVKKQIEDIFNNMNQLFKEYPDNEVTQAISKFSEAAAPTIPICVMGLYSAGKSAFINSLLGIELLPSASDPTTAKTFKISSGDKYEIRFEYGIGERKNVVLSFNDDGEYKPSQSGELEIIEKLEDVLKEETLEKRLYRALTIINGFDEEKNQGTPDSGKKYFVGDLIEITLPIHSPVLPFERYDFVIYDTPGSNSATNTNHTEVLKNAMEGQTNGLPIFVTEPDKMDGIDNNELIKTINELGGALDKSNLMIVVNKSDDKSPMTLAKKKENISNLVISTLNPAGMYFVSSVMGLGFKKKLSGKYHMEEDEEIPDWIDGDGDYDDTFRKNAKSFQGEKNPKSLYIYNIIGNKWQYDSYLALELDDSMRGYRNSGIHCVEYAIAEFAEKYALYNKCRNASAFLSQAMEQLSAIVCDLENENKNRLESIKSRLNAQQQALLDTLEKKAKKMKGEISESYAKEQESLLSQQLNAINISIKDELRKQWESISFGSRRSEAPQKMDELLKTKVERYNRNADLESQRFWERKREEMKQALISIIVESPVLDNEQKKLLSEKIKRLEIRYHQDIKGKFKKNDISARLWWSFGLWWIVVPKFENARQKFTEAYKEAITEINKAMNEQMSMQLDKFIKEINKDLIFLIEKHNPTIITLNEEYKACEEKIKEFEKLRYHIDDKKNEIQKLTSYKIVSVSQMHEMLERGEPA